MRHSIARQFVLSFLLCIASRAGVTAQEVPYQPPAPGDTVRLLTGPPPERREGTLLSVDADSLVVHFRGGGAATVVPWSRVYRLDVRHGRVSRRSNLGIGAFAGAVLGGAVFYLTRPGDHPVVARLVQYMGAGVAIGMGTSLLFPGRTRWREAFRPGVPLPPDMLVATQARTPRGGAISVQWSAIPMEGGVDSEVETGPAVRVSGYGLLSRLPYIEAFYTRAQGDANSALPRVQLMGVLAGRFAQSRQARVGFLLAAGIGRLVADTTERPPCNTPGCIRVPGVVYRDARLWTAVGNLGVIVGPSRRLAARGDVRVHVPVSEKGDAAESGRTRAELSVGITAQW